MSLDAASDEAMMEFVSLLGQSKKMIAEGDFVKSSKFLQKCRALLEKLKPGTFKTDLEAALDELEPQMAELEPQLMMLTFGKGKGKDNGKSKMASSSSSSHDEVEAGTSEAEPVAEVHACANACSDLCPTKCVQIKARYQCGHYQCYATSAMIHRCIRCGCGSLAKTEP